MRNLFCSAAAVSLLAAGAAVAQPVSARVEASDANTIDELIVTATRREESLRDVPMTISAVTAEQLEATGPIAGTGDLLRTVPGVRFNDLQSSNLSEVSIRGSGTQRATGADSGVGLFVNGAYVGSSTLGGRNFRHVDHFDAQRVEVLQGPQGALYGRNSEYGVVNIVSARPQFNNSGYVSGTYTGKLEQRKLIGVVNQQLSDEVAVRIGVQGVDQSKGFYYNPTSDKYYDSTEGWIARAQLRFRRGPLDIDFLVDAQDLDLPTFLNAYVLEPGRAAAIPLGYRHNRFVIPHDGQDGVNQKTHRAMILADYDLGWATLTSTSMVSNFKSRQDFASAIDLATEAEFQRTGQVGVYPLGQTSTLAKDRTFYQDIHLAGTALEGALEWLVGGDYLNQDDLNGTFSATTPCVLRVGAGICGGSPTAPVCYRLLPTSTACPTPFPNSFGTEARATLKNESESVYGSMKYRTGPFTFAGELRYSHDDKQASQVSFLLYTTTLAAPSAAYDFKANRLNYTATVSYTLPGDLGGLAYAKVGTGYRAGGVNARTSSPFAPNPFRPTYGNEDTTSYEVGYKGNLARNIFLRVAAYASRTEDAITSITDGCAVTNACGRGPTVFNINGGTVHARGVEAAIDGRFRVADGTLNIGLNGSRQRARYVDTPNNYSGLPLVGSSVAQIPKWNMSATIGYRRPLTDKVDGFFNVT
ncbi:MAG: TonB-dependent receptor, partial [Phenylobacterium sp.]|nr:TonB-dependent receptor [Phenylobacterium sp.]